MLNDSERGLPRAIRRAILSNRRRVTKRHTSFGRVKVFDFDLGEPDAETSMHNRVVYKHHTKGIMDRRQTFPLLSQLVG